MRRLIQGTALWLLGYCAVTGSLTAQTNDDINSGLQFNFSTPGARSLAMGGAFLALADDATAAYTNPAGLTNLTVGGSEFSMELRQWRYSNPFTAGGHAFGSPAGVGVDTVEGLQRGEVESEVSGISFLSVGYVLPRGVTLALYRHELANFKAQIQTQGAFTGPGNERSQLNRINPARSTLDLQIVNYGSSSAYSFRVPPLSLLGWRNRDEGQRVPGSGNEELESSVSVGVGVSYYQLDLASRTERFGVGNKDADGDGEVTAEDDRVNRQPGGFFGPADYLGDNIFNVQTQLGNDDAWGVNLGLLWKISPAWSLGAAYRLGPDFDVQARYVYGPRGPRPGQSASPNLCSSSRTRNCLGGQGVLHVPDVYGLGVAWGTREGTIKVTFDYDRVQYSQLTQDLVNILSRDRDDFDRGDYRVADANEFHLGFENILGIGSQLVATLRLGAWYDPAHSVEYFGNDPALLARFLPGDDEIHGAVGVGLVIRENLQVDVAIDLSDRLRTGSLSFVKFF